MNKDVEEACIVGKNSSQEGEKEERSQEGVLEKMLLRDEFCQVKDNNKGVRWRENTGKRPEVCNFKQLRKAK